jgi:hypothetical protein
MNRLEVMQPDGVLTKCAASFEACQRAVGGSVEPVRLRGGDILLVNEEGLMRNLPFNPGASLLTISRGIRTHIVGPAVYVPAALVKQVLG